MYYTVLYLHDSDRMACHARVHQDSSLDNVVVDTLVPVLINFERPARIFIGEEKTQVFGALTQAQDEAAAALPLMICLTTSTFSDEGLSPISQIQHCIAEKLPGVIPRIHDIYAIWMHALLKVSSLLCVVWFTY